MREQAYVVIPAYNEAKTIAGVIKGAKKHSGNIVVVDDGSRDSTASAAEKEKAVVLKHIINLGKGAALKTGCEYAVAHHAEEIVVMDADSQHDPEDIPKLLNELKNSDVVLTYRKLNSQMPFVFRLGNQGLGILTSLLFGIKVKDTQCGFRAFTSSAYKKIFWQAADYSVESEMIANIGKKKLKFSQVQIRTVYTEKYKGTTPIDGIKIGLTMVKLKLTR